MTDTMKALVYHGPGVMELEERPVPKPGPGEVQIRVRRCSICGSDLGAYRFASDRFAPPLVLGHEFSGDISELGEGVQGLCVGQRVTVNPMVLCRECFFCKRDQGNLCGERRSMGTAINGRTDGAMREYVVVKDWMVVALADSVSYEAGALLEPCGVCLACAKRGHHEDERSVAVIGTGPIGLLIIKFLKALGVPKIIASDILEPRLEKARACGADVLINAAEQSTVDEVKKHTEGYGADRVIIAAPLGSAINESFQMVRNGGTVVLVALMHEDVSIDPMEIVGRGLNFVGSYMFTSEMIEAAQMLADKRLAVEDLISSSYPLSQGKQALEVLNSPHNSEIKVQLRV